MEINTNLTTVGKGARSETQTGPGPSQPSERFTETVNLAASYTVQAKSIIFTSCSVDQFNSVAHSELSRKGLRQGKYNSWTLISYVERNFLHRTYNYCNLPCQVNLTNDRTWLIIDVLFPLAKIMMICVNRTSVSRVLPRKILNAEKIAYCLFSNQPIISQSYNFERYSVDN